MGVDGYPNMPSNKALQAHLPCLPPQGSSYKEGFIWGAAVPSLQEPPNKEASPYAGPLGIRNDNGGTAQGSPVL